MLILNESAEALYYSSTKTLNTIVIPYQWGRGPMVMFTIIPVGLLYPVSSPF